MDRNSPYYILGRAAGDGPFEDELERAIRDHNQAFMDDPDAMRRASEQGEIIRRVSEHEGTTDERWHHVAECFACHTEHAGLCLELKKRINYREPTRHMDLSKTPERKL